MFGNNHKPNRGQKTIEDSMHGLATVLALLAALMCSGLIFEHTYDPAFNYLVDAYGDDSLAELGAFGFGVLSTATVFFLARIFIVLALTLIASRLLVYAF